MKTKAFFILMAMCLSFGAMAQELNEDYDGVWRRTKSWGIGYVTSTLKNNGGSIDSNLGVATTLTNTYFLHRKPIAGFLKFGLDAKWFDFNYIRYNVREYVASQELHIGNNNIEIGMGIGPSVNIAPFARKSNAAKDLRVGVYFHFSPTFSILTKDEGGEINAYYGFSPVCNLGLNVQWKMAGIGIEGRWSTPHYSSLDKSSRGDDKFTMSSLRIFVRLCY